MRNALKDGKIYFNPDKGALYFFFNAGKDVGYNNGKKTSWIRVEYTSGNEVHGHPFEDGTSLSLLLSKATTKNDFMKMYFGGID
jgi:hypothetical protein